MATRTVKDLEGERKREDLRSELRRGLMEAAARFARSDGWRPRADSAPNLRSIIERVVADAARVRDAGEVGRLLELLALRGDPC